MIATACGAPPTSPASPSAASASKSSPSTSSAPLAGPVDDAPTYTELFDAFFAPGTPGHCATSGCHADPGHAVWLCGTTKGGCYAGMLDVGLIDAREPARSMIADPTRSPLTWINAAGGSMPLDAQGTNPSARDAITAWAASGALDN